LSRESGLGLVVESLSLGLGLKRFSIQFKQAWMEHCEGSPSIKCAKQFDALIYSILDCRTMPVYMYDRFNLNSLNITSRTEILYMTVSQSLKL